VEAKRADRRKGDANSVSLLLSVSLSSRRDRALPLPGRGVSTRLDGVVFWVSITKTHAIYDIN
jgi:hypothetical protein